MYIGNRLYEGAHRVAYREFKGAIPRGKLVRHTCDNPACCNPAHLILGTASSNAMDSVKRKRHAHARKTHCVNGHPFTKDNIYRPPRGGRQCRSCRKKSDASS